MKLYECVPNGKFPAHPSPHINYPYLFAVSIGDKADAGLAEDNGVDDAVEYPPDIFMGKRQVAAEKKARPRKPAAKVKPVDLAASGLQLVETKAEAKISHLKTMTM
jgi:hypothetical protein